MTYQQKLIIFNMQKKYYQLRINKELSKKNPNQSKVSQLRKERNKIQDKIYYIENRDIQILSSKISQLKNKERNLEVCREWRNKNREKYQEYQKKWRSENKEHLEQYKKDNIEKLREIWRNNAKKRYYRLKEANNG